ncbi:MAG: protein kinase [Muribaculaceae bacterium]|nr:protein kinase [Muribaculaceae bacterium]
MESGFVSDLNMGIESGWQPIPHHGSGHFEFFKVRHFGALLFAKRPAAAFRNDLVTVESLKKEFYIGYNLNHPSIVKYLKMEDGAVFEEYVDGVSLRQMIDFGDIRLRSPQFLEQICRSLIETVSYLHSHGVIHNDIKPENVMIARIDNQLKLVDLGAATSDMWDATGGFTPSYCAPEQGITSTNVYTDIFLIGKLMEQLAAIAGVKSLWRKFIRKATCKYVYGRFYSDKEALEAIPSYKRSQRLKLGLAITVIVVVNVIAFIFSYNSTYEDNYEDKKINDQVDNIVSKSDISIISDPISEAIDNGKALFEQANDSIYADMNAKISRFTANRFKKLIFPKCRIFAKMPEGPDKDNFGADIDTIINSVINEVLKFAVESAKPYEENDYYYYALSCFKSSLEEQYDIADSIKYSAPVP